MRGGISIGTQEKLFKVGEYNKAYNEILEINLPIVDIMQSQGFAVHIEKRHPECIKYIPMIPEIICSPDYIGTNQKEPNSIELVKILDQNVLLAIKLDTKAGGLYVASLYEVRDSKISNRLHSGYCSHLIIRHCEKCRK